MPGSELWQPKTVATQRTIKDEPSLKEPPRIGHTLYPTKLGDKTRTSNGLRCGFVFFVLTATPRALIFRKFLQSPGSGPTADQSPSWHPMTVATTKDTQGRTQASRNPKDRTHPPTKLGGSARAPKDGSAGASYSVPPTILDFQKSPTWLRDHVYSGLSAAVASYDRRHNQGPSRTNPSLKEPQGPDTPTNQARRQYPRL